MSCCLTVTVFTSLCPCILNILPVFYNKITIYNIFHIKSWLKREPLSPHQTPTPIRTRRFYVLSATSPAGNGAADAPPVFRSFTSSVFGFHATHRSIFCPGIALPVLAFGNSNRPITTNNVESPNAEKTPSRPAVKDVFLCACQNAFVMQLLRR